MLNKNVIIEICEKKGTIPLDKLKTDPSKGRVDSTKSPDWVSSFFQKSEFESLDLEKFRSEVNDFILSIIEEKRIELGFELNGHSCDFFIRDLGIGFKCLGLFEFSEINVDRKFQLNSYNAFNSSGFHLIQIFEDIWMEKKEILKSRIRNLINMSDKIYARKCEVREILDTSVVTKFVGSTHTQGSIGSSIKLGLYFKNDLVSIMTFGKLRKNLGQSSSSGSYELLRFSNKLNTNVVGGASKLFSHFIKNYDPSSIISYADKCWSNDDCLYYHLGMERIHDSQPSYFYISGKKRKGRFGFRKDVLLQGGYDPLVWGEHTICLSNEIYRIFDVGTIKFEWKRHLSK